MNDLAVTSASQALTLDLRAYENYIELFASEQDVRESSRQLYKRTLKQFFKWVMEQGLDLNLLQIADINRYKDSLQERGLSKLSIGSYIVAVRRFYEWAESKKWYANIAKGVKTPRKKEAYRKQHLTEEKSSELLKFFKQDRKRSKSKKAKKPISSEAVSRDFAIVNLMLRTGLRTIEVVRADIADITYKRDRRVLKVWGKGRTDKEEDFVVLTDKTFAPIQDYIQKYRKNAKAGEPLFTSLSSQNKGKRLTTRTISGICKEGLKKVGLDGKEYTAHSYRHTTAVAILKAGGSINEVQAVLRHSSVDTSRIYTKSIEEEMRLQHPSELRLDSYFI